MTDQDQKELMQAYMASGAMDNAARYLQDGRQYASLSDAELQTIWVKLWRGFYDHDRDDLWMYCLDAEGELTLRGLQSPEHLLPVRTRKRIANRMRKNAERPELVQELQEDFDDFVRQYQARRH